MTLLFLKYYRYPKRMRKVTISALLVASVLLLNNSNTYGQVKTSSLCKKIGSKLTTSTATFECVKSGNRLIWKSSSTKEGKSVNSKPNPQPSTLSPTPTNPPFNLTDTSKFRPTIYCQLKQTYSNYFGTGFGFPRPDYRLKNSGTLKTLLSVSYTHLRAHET